MRSNADIKNGDRLIIERDVAITMDDGIVLRGDIFRPVSSDETPCPVLVTSGPYGKGVPWREGYSTQWKFMTTKHRNLLSGSSKEYMVWEVPDPEIWCGWGYACFRIDSRGSGRSPGHLDILSPREMRDFHDCIEWVADRPWCTGSVGLSGISYYAASQWLVASLQPPHLKAMVAWEGFADFYQQNRANPGQDISKRPLDDDHYRHRSAVWDKVEVPFLSCANLAGHGLHPRGNFEAFMNASSKQKWLSCHPGRHEEWYYLDQGMDLQKQFLDHFLKGEDNGWESTPPVTLRERRPFDDQFAVVRHEASWPLPNTKWTKIFLSVDDLQASTLSWRSIGKQSSADFDVLTEVLTFHSAPLQQELEITGPMAAKLFAASSTSDMDLFLTLQTFSPDGREVDFEGTVDPRTPLSQGWLRASHRKLDKQKSLPYRPYLAHDEQQPLEPAKAYELDIEVLPTHIILPKGFTLALQIAGKDFERPAQHTQTEISWTARGSGPFLHTSPNDRPTDTFGGRTTIFLGGETGSYLLLPIISR
ncbi:hypothetical protein LTR10_015150 [Elasticomyces elasticus]|uniref:Xaa-Pro dipeptidyl-peptidase C-terminal domain-containing protein n=1 Tax=Exophiala sideris TaxID=1016849 RepID=A0ABR0JRF5_9EURO|nr:hypothetical protein LTR10_015150 [Elasticomyces elasticus]KAK5034652.1 hypothetical protein LTR13_006308 [Exophiala sideris]KAK5040026.1 hypothetical protein LTS07_000522 [Exophiala sideris]KAK5068404.1 hypothetical protein LTR69_000523 [Exophiala sideris]KAK5187706.1 hypothetical protein LTR44_000523 [Eurotiomycetes sp. CCFEE 6388]